MRELISRNRHRLTVVIGHILLGFVNTDTVEVTTRQTALQLTPEGYAEVFHCRDDSVQEVDVVIQVLVINLIDNRLLKDVLEFLQVDNIPSLWVWKPLNSDFEDIVVTMTPDVIALIKYSLVAFVGERRVVKAMCGGKRALTRYVDHEGAAPVTIR